MSRRQPPQWQCSRCGMEMAEPRTGQHRRYEKDAPYREWHDALPVPHQHAELVIKPEPQAMTPRPEQPATKSGQRMDHLWGADWKRDEWHDTILAIEAEAASLARPSTADLAAMSVTERSIYLAGREEQALDSLAAAAALPDVAELAAALHEARDPGDEWDGLNPRPCSGPGAHMGKAAAILAEIERARG